MAGVFMMSSSTIFLRTRVVPRWIAFTGYVLAIGLLLSIGMFTWVPAIFPLWVLLVSVCILLEGQRPRAAVAGTPEATSQKAQRAAAEFLGDVGKAFELHG